MEYDTSGIRPFNFIRRADPNHLLTFIRNEYPQTIALILSHLEANKASIILKKLPLVLQSDVTRRIAIIDRTWLEVLLTVEQVLEKKLSGSAESCFASGGIEYIVEVLCLVDADTRNHIIEALEDEDPELAEWIKINLFV